jgi:dynein heavy chain
MSSSGLDWKPIFSAWLLSRTNATEKNLLTELFEKTFLELFTWTTQNLTYRMDVLQVNIVTQVSKLKNSEPLIHFQYQEL